MNQEEREDLYYALIELETFNETHFEDAEEWVKYEVECIMEQLHYDLSEADITYHHTLIIKANNKIVDLFDKYVDIDRYGDHSIF